MTRRVAPDPRRHGAIAVPERKPNERAYSRNPSPESAAAARKPATAKPSRHRAPLGRPTWHSVPVYASAGLSVGSGVVGGYVFDHERERVPLDVNELIREVLRLLHNDIALRGASLRAELGAGLPLVEGDRIQLQQVVLNLAVDGLDAMTEQPAGRRHLTIRSDLHRAKMRIEVEDTGRGIAEADRERLFQPFYTTKATGMGMGLAIARSIVEAHGGSLSVASHPGPGATFHVTFLTTLARCAAAR